MRSFLSALAIGLLVVGPSSAGDDGLLGFWKFNIYEGEQQTPFWLIRLDRNKDNNMTASAESLRGAPKVKITDVKVVGDLLTMNLRASVESPMGGVSEITLDFEARLPKPGAKKIYGTVKQGTGLITAVMEATTSKTPFELDRDLLTRTPSDPKALATILDVIELAKENKVDAKDLQAWIDSSLKAAEQYGPRMQTRHTLRLLEALRPQKEYKQVALETALKVSKQLDAKTPFNSQLQILTAVAGVLRNADQAAEAKTLEARIEKLEPMAYTDYEKTSLNFKVEKYAGRKAKTKRTVLVELFTGAQCPPCVAADLAFDGVEKSYANTDVVLLQYHTHIPRAEPMANPDSVERFDFYAENYPKKVRGMPSCLFNGKPEVTGGGGRDGADEKYKEYCAAINKLLEAPDTVNLSATAVRQGDKIAITAKVDGLDKPAETIRLRFALVEDWVRFQGSNGMQYHHRVVRALPGGVKGVALKAKSSDHAASVDLEALRKQLNKYLDDDYPDGARPMRMANLHVVAFVQNEETTEVLQAIDVAVK